MIGNLSSNLLAPVVQIHLGVCGLHQECLGDPTSKNSLLSDDKGLRGVYGSEDLSPQRIILPHLHMMEENAPVSNDTAGTTPKIVSKAIPTLVCTRQLLAIYT